MDMKLLRQKLYDEMVNHLIEFIGTDGLSYNGYCLDWLEDESFVMDEISVLEERESDHLSMVGTV